MKFEQGRFIVKMKDTGGIGESHLFLHVWRDKSSTWWYRIDEQDKKVLDESARDYILQDMYLIAKLKDKEAPVFNKVIITIQAETSYGSTHVWTKRVGEALEKLIKRFPGLVNKLWIEKSRKEKILEYILIRNKKNSVR